MTTKIERAGVALQDQAENVQLSGSADHKKLVADAWAKLEEMKSVKAAQENRRFQDLAYRVKCAIEQAQAVPASHQHLLPAMGQRIEGLLREMRKLVAVTGSQGRTAAKPNVAPLTPGEQQLAIDIRADDAVRRAELQKQRSECLHNIALSKGPEGEAMKQNLEMELKTIDEQLSDLAK